MTTPETPEQIFNMLWEDKKKLHAEIARLKAFSNYLLHWAWINSGDFVAFTTPAELKAYINSEIDLIDSERKKK
jgi:hypothetical protein